MRAHYHSWLSRDDTLVITVMKTQLAAMEEVPIAADEGCAEKDGLAPEQQAE